MFTSRNQSAPPLNMQKALERQSCCSTNGGPYTILNYKTGLALDCKGGKSGKPPVAYYMPIPGKKKTQEWYTRGRNEDDIALKNSTEPGGTEIFLSVVKGKLIVSPVAPTIEGRIPAFLEFKEIDDKYKAILIDGKALTCPENEGAKITLQDYDENNKYQLWSIFVNRLPGH